MFRSFITISLLFLSNSLIAQTRITGKILDAEACLIANRKRLSTNTQVLETASLLLEMFGAHLNGKQNLAIFANVRAQSEEEISTKIFNQEVIGGLEGPTISRILTRSQESFFAIHIVVRKDKLHKAISELRKIGGSGVVVSPVNFIFEEQPKEILNMLGALEIPNEDLSI